MERIECLADAGDALSTIQAKLSFFQTVLGGALYDNATKQLTLSQGDQAGIFYSFQEIHDKLDEINEFLASPAAKAEQKAGAKVEAITS